MTSPAANSSADAANYGFSMYIQILQVWIVPFIYTIIVIVGFLGNMLVIIVIISNKQMRNTTNILIISLALADLAFIIFCVPFTAVVYAKAGWHFGDVMCKIYYYTIYTTAYCSVYTLVLMSLDRFLAVVFPLDSKTWRTQRNTTIAVVIVWVVFLVVHLPLFVRAGVYSGQGFLTCTDSALVIHNDSSIDIIQFNNEFGKLYYSFFFVFGYLLPLTVICILYGIMIKCLLFGRTSQMSQSSEAMRSKRRVTMMVVSVVVIFAICWLPIHIVFIIQQFKTGTHTTALFVTCLILGNVMAYTNSMINPIIYAFISENFRRGFAKVLCFRRIQTRRLSDRLEQTTVRGLLNKPSGPACRPTPTRVDAEDMELNRCAIEAVTQKLAVTVENTNGTATNGDVTPTNKVCIDNFSTVNPVEALEKELEAKVLIETDFN